MFQLFAQTSHRRGFSKVATLRVNVSSSKSSAPPSVCRFCRQFPTTCFRAVPHSFPLRSNGREPRDPERGQRSKSRRQGNSVEDLSKQVRRGCSSMNRTPWSGTLYTIRQYVCASHQPINTVGLSYLRTFVNTIKQCRTSNNPRCVERCQHNDKSCSSHGVQLANVPQNTSDSM